ncbi:MAG: hypothetical protein KAS32_20170 [Candidatus Peribacteraceae bacterium]|nr:hypothetical protein [Candidatus Peribacteraceae bacterium]
MSEDIIMDGTDGTDTVGSYVIIHRMKCLTYGTSGPNLGVITAVAAVDGTITAQISIGAGQTLMAIYGIPSIQTAYMPNFYVNLHDNTSPATATEISFSLLVNEIPDTLTTKYLIKHIGGLISFGTSASDIPFRPYKKIVGPAIIKVQSIGSADDLFVSAGFDIILIDN